MDYGMPAKRKGGAAGTSVLDLDTAGLYRPRTKVCSCLMQCSGWLEAGGLPRSDAASGKGGVL